jgi:predicted metal-dependent hydrolase
VKKNIKGKITIDDLVIEVTQKRMRSLRLRVMPPLAEVKVSAPLRLSWEEIENFIQQKISWIKASRTKILAQKYVAPKKIIDGEFHEIFGEKFLLITNHQATRNLCFIDGTTIQLQSKKFIGIQKRQRLLDDLYRQQLAKIAPQFIEKFEEKMQIKVAEFRIKKMKTRWGTCNRKAQRIWINLELAKKPICCLEYLIVHEMVHFFEAGHNQKFYALMTKFLPQWQEVRKLLKSVSC